MTNDRDPTEGTTIIDLPRGASQLVTADYSLALNTGELLNSVTTSPAQSSQPTAGTGETTTLTIGSGAINTGGAVTVDQVSKSIKTVCQFRVTVPSNATRGTYKVSLACDTTDSNTKPHTVVLRIW